jgi:malate dehydrogenase (oxaloacetate-decarboxylating)
MVAAANALGQAAPAITDPTKALLPPLEGIREIMVRIASAAAEMGVDQGHIDHASPAELQTKIRASMWNPAYRDPPTDGTGRR